MSVKIRAKNPSDILQTLECDASGHLLVNSATLEATLTAIETDAAALEVLQTAGNSSLADIKTAVEIIDNIVLTDGAAYSGGSSKGVLLLAKDNSGNFKPIELDGSNQVKVSSSSGADTFEVHTSTHNSVSSGASITSSVETLTKRNTQVGFIIDSSDSNPPGQVEIEVSADNSTFSTLSAGGGFNFVSGGTGKIASLNAAIPFPYVRIKMTAASGGTHNVVIKITH